MLRFWRKPGSAAPERAVWSIRIDQLSAHLLRDLNLKDEPGVFLPDSIQSRNLPRSPSF
jgi:hypothetical protein